MVRNPCRCVSSKVLGSLCITNCISIGAFTVTEGPSKVILAVVFPTVGAAIAESVLRAGAQERRDRGGSHRQRYEA